MNRALVAVVLAAATWGCALARHPHVQATATVPSAWSRDVSTGKSSVDRDALADWWTTFDDPVLSRVVDEAISGNLDVRTAVSRVRQARAQVEVDRANLLPSVTVSGGATANRSAEEALGDLVIPATVQRSYDVTASASWEADVFGRLQSTVNSAVNSAGAQAASLQDVLVATVGDAATDYIKLRELQERIAIATANRATQQETLDIARFRVQAGLTTQLDVEQARSNLESTEASLASLRMQTSQQLHALAILLGVPPASLDEELEDSTGIPESPSTIAFGVPAETIRRRPDVRAAELRLAAQSWQVDATRGDLYPKFTLTGSIGLETLKIASLFLPGSSFWQVSPAVSWKAFDRRQIRQNIAIQGELETQSAIAYESTVLGALKDVEDALVAYAEESNRRAHLGDAVDAAQSAADLSLRQYNSGLHDFRDVLDAQRTLLSLQDQLASSRSSLSQDLVRLYRSVGGGWAADQLRTETSRQP